MQVGGQANVHHVHVGAFDQLLRVRIDGDSCQVQLLQAQVEVPIGQEAALAALRLGVCDRRHLNAGDLLVAIEMPTAHKAQAQKPYAYHGHLL